MSIRSRLLLLALFATVLPALFETARFIHERQDAIDTDTEQLVSIAQAEADDLSHRIQGTEQLLYGLAQAPALTSGDRAACSAFLSEVRERYPQYTGILTITPEGHLFCDSLKSGRELDLNDRAYFQMAKATRDAVVLEPVFGRLTGVPVLQIAFPARGEGGELLFVLLASLDLRQVVALGGVTVPEANAILMDRAGTALATSLGEAAPEFPGSSLAETELFRLAGGKAGATDQVEGPDGVSGVWAVADSPALSEAKLYLLVGAPHAALVAAANERFVRDLGLLAGVAGIVFVAVWMISGLVIRRQVGQLSSMATQMAGGDLSARIPEPLPRGELGALMGVLNQTAESLEQQRADIEGLNDRLRQSQRMESLGQLTGGVAHDFNNLLTVVMGNAELLTMDPAANPQQRELAEMIAVSARRGAELTHSLLAFARKQALSPKAVDLNQMVAGMHAILRRALGEQVKVELIRGEGLWRAMVDQGLLENALLNLCLNARDAMPGGGRLTLETGNIQLDSDYAARHAEVMAGAYVMLSVSDTGMGIPPEQLDRIFEPFFTTKEVGKGTGLGLAMVYGFVKQSGGHISVYSEEGQGTSVKLYLPRAIEAAESADPEDKSAVEVVGGTETILLVEDDDGVRRYAGGLLRTHGYTVVEAANGTEALAVIEARDDLDLLFTDVVMPGGMNGRQLADAAREIRPGLRVLFTSGYTDEAIVHHGELEPGARLLNKPYGRAELARAIREALAEPVDSEG
ncbi:MAG TPA: ATP-binding protein [Tepidiformaceae bacterium]|nr:ATP-binding protein [Tepidiformaceae bacterium]